MVRRVILRLKWRRVADDESAQYLQRVYEPALYQATKSYVQLHEVAARKRKVTNLPKGRCEFGVLRYVLAGYWALVEGCEPDHLKALRLRLQRKVAEKFRVAIVGNGMPPCSGRFFAELDQFEEGRDYEVATTRFRWLNPRAYGGTPKPEDGGDE